MTTRTYWSAACLLAALALVSSASADVVSLTLETQGGVQKVVNGVDITTGTTSDGYRPRRLTLNPATGMLYLSQYKFNGIGASGVRMYDSGSTSLVNSPTEATTGQLDGAANEYTGSVQSGARDWDVGTGKPIAFNPNYTNNGGVNQGAVAEWIVASGGNNQYYDFVPQTSAENWGQLKEGTIGAPLNDAARFADYSISSAAMNTPSGSAGGIAYLDRRNNTSSVLVDRYVTYSTRSGGYNFGLYVSEVSPDVTGTPSNTAVGSRTTSSQGKVLDQTTDFAGLVPLISDDVRDIAVLPAGGDDFDVYFLSNDGTNTYLSAVRATLPAAKAGWSWTQLDVSGDAGDGINYLQLRDTVANVDISGWGITFSADGSKLYVASDAALSTGHSTFDDGRIYIFDVAAVPEPATMALLAVGGLAMAGAAARRRKSA